MIKPFDTTNSHIINISRWDAFINHMKSYCLVYDAIARGVKRFFWTVPKGSDGTFAFFIK